MSLMEPTYAMLANANGLTTFGGTMGQGTQGLVNSANFEEMLTAQKQAAAALGRAMTAAKIAERSGNLAVNIANRAVQSARSLATLPEQGVKDAFGASEPPIMEVGPSPFLKPASLDLSLLAIVDYSLRRMLMLDSKQQHQPSTFRHRARQKHLLERSKLWSVEEDNAFL
ncbi:unnamed protein product [Amoebophrya sp. A25]|nr:unnamed protein product [Amoebophrya sp. A25]|eukprot:GSA25T00002009001.1